MRGQVSQYEIHTPKTLAEALKDLGHRQCIAFAGGTDLMVQLEAGHLPSGSYLNIANLWELRQIDVSPTHVNIGSLSTYRDIQTHDVLTNEFPNLVQAARETGGIAIQNRGTLGGNIANASPAADSPPALLAYFAEIELCSMDGSRWVSYAEFHTAYKKSIRNANELIKTIRIPRTFAKSIHYYRKVGTRKAQAISKVVLAATRSMDGSKIKDISLAFGSIAPVPLRCLNTEKTLKGQKLTPELIQVALDELNHEISPIDDIRSNAGFRRAVAANLLEEFLTQK